MYVATSVLDRNQLQMTLLHALDFDKRVRAASMCRLGIHTPFLYGVTIQLTGEIAGYRNRVFTEADLATISAVTDTASELLHPATASATKGISPE
mmetsp:Transcript_6502/g.12315  ORF Transcript_6502/g.12315 Transcript_6502/m.12315 type:complete len:95 (-) Transcript_6502:329-613(-)